MPEIKVRKADGTLATMIVDEEFVESLHNNWKAQMNMNGYNADGTKKEDGQFTQEERACKKECSYEGCEQQMTEEERKELNPEFCAEGLRYILHHYANFIHPEFSAEETAAIVGAIMLIRGKCDNWCYQSTNEEWKKMMWNKDNV